MNELRRLVREPLVVATVLVGAGVLIFYLTQAPERPDAGAAGGAVATQFPSVTPGASPTFGAPPTLGPPTPTATPDMSSIERDLTRRRDLLLIAAILARYFEAEGAFPVTGANVQSLCVYDGLDAGCELRAYADQSAGLPKAPAGEPYAYLSESGRSWIVFIELEQPPTPESLCNDARAATLPHPDRIICVSGGERAEPGP